MASKGIASPLIRYAAGRGYATAPLSVKQPSMATNMLPSKTFIAAYDNGSPVTRITIAFKAGTRYEPTSDTGISHILRASAGLSTGSANAFISTRKLAQIGASFSASGDREFVYYTLEATQDNLAEAMECLNNIVSNQEFRPWELSDNAPKIKYEIASLAPQIRAVDLLHKAAFRRGLGNSLFISPNKIGSISSESLQHFAASTLTPSRCAIAIVGDTQEKAALIAQNLKICSGEGAVAQATKYCGGDMRKEMGGDLAHITLALPGGAAGSGASLALAVAAKALGNGPNVKWGTDNSPLAKAIGNIGPFAAAGFNVSYSDAGLFGVVLTVPKDEANTAVKAVAKLLKGASLSSSDIIAGVNQLKHQVLTEAEYGTALSEQLAAQGLYYGKALTPAELADKIANVKESDVKAAWSEVAKCKLSMGAAGNLAFVPYTDEL